MKAPKFRWACSSCFLKKEVVARSFALVRPSSVRRPSASTMVLLMAALLFSQLYVPYHHTIRTRECGHAPYQFNICLFCLYQERS